MKKYTKTKIDPGLVAFYDIRPGNRAGLVYSYNLEPALGTLCQNHHNLISKKIIITMRKPINLVVV